MQYARQVDDDHLTPEAAYLRIQEAMLDDRVHETVKLIAQAKGPLPEALYVVARGLGDDVMASYYVDAMNLRNAGQSPYLRIVPPRAVLLEHRRLAKQRKPLVPRNVIVRNTSHIARQLAREKDNPTGLRVDGVRLQLNLEDPVLDKVRKQSAERLCSPPRGAVARSRKRLHKRKRKHSFERPSPPLKHRWQQSPAGDWKRASI